MILRNFLSDEMFWPEGPIFGSGVVVSQNSIPIGLQGTLYDPLECWETIIKVLKIQTSTLDIFGLMSAFLDFMALGVKFLWSAEFLCQNGPHKAETLKNFNKRSWGLGYGLWNLFLPFLFFLRSLQRENTLKEGFCI